MHNDVNVRQCWDGMGVARTAAYDASLSMTLCVHFTADACTFRTILLSSVKLYAI